MDSTQSSARSVKRNEGRNCEVHREGLALWEMAATSLHNDVLSDSEERHERTTPYGACAHMERPGLGRSSYPTTQSLLKKENRGTVAGMQFLCKIWPLHGFKVTHARQELLKKRREIHELSSIPKKIQR